ncbi:MAG: hypothetical protein ACTHXA_01600 [Gulosibacter sp.]|uniref:hypothetical protein n=1 Tax=Gulosibacter sp. TaxID=2817531 RepID=UPI003F91F4A9
MTTTLLPRTADLNFERFGFRFTRLTDLRWRIAQPTGAIVGYLERRPGEGDAARATETWAISRMTADRRRFVTLGTFDTSEEAIAALKWM